MPETKSPNENYLEELRTDAFNWLNVVGEYHHMIPKPDIPLNRFNSNVLKFLGDRMAENDYDTTRLLATFEREASQKKSESWITDEEIQNTVRTNQFYNLARVFGKFTLLNSSTASETWHGAGAGRA